MTTKSTFSILRETLLELELIPEIGDIVEWNYGFFEVNGILENQLIGGMEKIIGVLHYKHSYQDNHLLIYQELGYIMSVDIKLKTKTITTKSTTRT